MVATTPSPHSSVAEILFGLAKRGLSLRLNDAGDGLKLRGPQEARTDRIKETLKSAKPALIAHLREQAGPEATRHETAAPPAGGAAALPPASVAVEPIPDNAGQLDQADQADPADEVAPAFFLLEAVRRNTLPLLNFADRLTLPSGRIANDTNVAARGSLQNGRFALARLQAATTPEERARWEEIADRERSDLDYLVDWWFTHPARAADH